MLKITKRKLTPKEIAIVKKWKLSFWAKLEQVSMLFVGITFVFLCPFLLYDKYFPVPSEIQLFIAIPLLILAIIATYWAYKKLNEVVYMEKQPLSEVMAEVFEVETTRAIERKDPEDFGPAYYLEVLYNGQPKTLFLWGQYLYDVALPNTAFEIIRRADNKAIIDIQIKGKYFEPEKILPAFDKKIWKSEDHEIDGEVLDIHLDDIK